MRASNYLRLGMKANARKEIIRRFFHHHLKLVVLLGLEFFYCIFDRRLSYGVGYL